MARAARSGHQPLLCRDAPRRRHRAHPRPAPAARLHEEDFQAADIAAIAAPVTKMAMAVLGPAQVPGAPAQAFHLMRSGTPVVPALMGWGAIPGDHRPMAGMAGRRTGGLATDTAGRTLVHAGIEPTQTGRVFAPDCGIASDAGAALRPFVAAARERSRTGCP